MSHRIFRLVSSLFLVLALTAIASGPMPAHAAGPWYVAPGGNDSNTCLSPGTACTTINGALAKPGFIPGDTIRVAIGIYTGIGNEVVLLDKNVTLSGGWNATFTTQSGKSTIDGGGARRGITLSSGITATIEHLIILNCASFDGSGIFNGGTLTLTESAVSNNTWDGIYNHNGTLALNNSALNGNTYSGIYSDGGLVTLNNSGVNNNGGTGIQHIKDVLTLNNSTISGNMNGGIFTSIGTITLNNSTVSANISQFGGSISGGIYNDQGSVVLRNSILAGNTDVAGISPDCSGLISSSGYNLIGNISGCTFNPSNGDLTSVDPMLGPLQDNGGPTFTHALLLGSPAIDAGNPAGCKDQNGNLLNTDQRGVARPQGTRCDIGAFELDAGGGGGGTEVFIDIKPGRFPNRIKLTNNVCNDDDNLYVAILTTPSFNARGVNASTLQLGDPNLNGKATPIKSRITDVDGDGDRDMALTFTLCSIVTNGALNINSTEMVLTGMTLEGVAITGRDSVKVVR